MKRRVKAKISWVSREKGGRNSPPPGPRFVTVCRFEEDKDSYPKEAWSLVLEFSNLLGGSLDVTADVSFLVDDAPHQLLHSGSKFELFEGRQLIAKGEVI